MTPSITRWVILLLLASPFIAATPTPVNAVEPPAAGFGNLAPRDPTPTRRMGQRKVKKTVLNLQKKDYSSFLCPGGSVACPVPPGDLDEITSESITELEDSLDSLAAWFRVGFECVEFASEMSSCGGCLALGQGQDCSTIENTRATGCEGGKCVVYMCMEGYSISPDKKSCVKRDNSATGISKEPQLVIG